MRYDTYNREERVLCCHLFRMLHERWLDTTDGALSRLLELLSKKNLEFRNTSTEIDLSRLQLCNVAILPEVALIRDAYHCRIKEPSPFVDGLVATIKEQEGVTDCRAYSELPEVLRNPCKTHPRQIRAKAASENISLTAGEMCVYGALQGMFNAKPDLAITVDDVLLTFEAKFTEAFDDTQLRRTWKIAQVWASPLLYKDLGFRRTPAYTVAKLGLSRHRPDLTWQEVFSIAKEFYSDTDRSLVAFRNALNYDSEPAE